jgi:hypothetical protein
MNVAIEEFAVAAVLGRALHLQLFENESILLAQVLLDIHREVSSSKSVFWISLRAGRLD